mgnify:CR=1 FL=1
MGAMDYYANEKNVDEKEYARPMKGQKDGLLGSGLGASNRRSNNHHIEDSMPENIP